MLSPGCMHPFLTDSAVVIVAVSVTRSCIELRDGRTRACCARRSS